MKKLKHLLALFLMVILSACLLFGCSQKPEPLNPPVKGGIGELMGDNYSKINKIVFSDGTGTNKQSTLTDQNQINRFLNKYINASKIKKAGELPLATGWRLGLQLYHDNDLLFTADYGDPFTYKNVDYKFENESQITEDTFHEIDEFIHSTDGGWKVVSH